MPPTSSASRKRPVVQGGAVQATVDLDFIAVRAKLIEVGAFLDRVERHGLSGDFRCVALRKAAQVLIDGDPQRARRILEALSDPTVEPAATSSGKAAVGAWQPRP